MARLLKAAVVIAAVAIAGCGSGSAPTANRLEKRTLTAGAIEVAITPDRVDSTGATFKVVFDTHSGVLDLDVAANAVLTVDNMAWQPPTWTGDAPSGHHREGTLTFASGGSAATSARIVLTGLPGPVETTWDLALR